MILPKSHLLIGIYCFSIFILLSNINCQRDGRNFSFLSTSSHDESFEARNRAAYIDSSLSRNAERFNSNSQLNKHPSRTHSSHLDGDRGSANHEPKILDERQERPEKSERPMKNQKEPDSGVIHGSSHERDDDRDSSDREDDKEIRRVTENSKNHPDSVTGSSLFSGEVSTRTTVKKKNRSTRPSSGSGSSSSVTSTRSPSVSGDRHINTHVTSTQSSLLSTHRPSTVAPTRPGQTNSNFASINAAKAPKETHPFLSSHSCGGNITLSSLTTSISSPGWTEGNKYPPNIECVWIISTVRSHFTNKEPSIRVRVKHLEIEQDKVDCPYDYLELRGYKKLCGFIQNKEILINSSSLVIVFRTDSNYEDRGFDLEVYSQVDDCTPEVKASSSGEITSPGFPKNYPDSTDCWTLINANTFVNGAEAIGSRSGGVLNGGPENLTISVTFDFIELEPDDQCAYDFVEFFEVDRVTKKPTKSLGKFCDEKSINKVDRSSDYMPDARATSNQHSLSRHHGPSSSSSSSSSSSLPSLTNDNFKAIHAKGPYLLVHFKSDQLLNLRGFKASYKVEAALSRSSISDCDWIPDETAMTLASPLHPKSYPPNKDCSLILKSPRPDQKIVLIFESFHMEIDNNCTFDRLEIYDDYAISETDSSHSSSTNNKPPNRHGDPIYLSSSLQSNGIPMSKEPTKVFCGHKSSKFKYLSGGPVLRLRFVSDSLGEYQGFFARYNFIQSDSDEPPKPVQLFTETPQNASIIPGSSHLLSCHPVNLPNRFQITDNKKITHNSNNADNANNNDAVKSILWFKDNQLITDGVSENGTKLLIREFSQSDVGRYTCKYGSATSEAWLKVQNTDCRIIFRKRPRDSVLSEGEFTIFECNAISSSLLASKVTITWTKNGKKVVNNSRVDKLKNGYLVINGVTKEDSGHYFCVVRLEDDPSCTSQAGARLDVNVRANVEDICGKPNLALPSKQKPLLDAAGKIVGGVDAQKGAFPWQVMFWDVNRKSFCGGALLNERWIATAAHCFTQNKYSPPPPPLDTIVVRLGKFDQKETEDQELNTKIQDIIKHPDYNPETFDNDLALVRVRDHIIFTDYIKPVCVGLSKSIIDGLFFTDNHRSIKMGHVTGWGQLKENGPQPRYLQELRMPIVDQQTCKGATSFAVTNNMFCAGYAQEIIGDACKGDSGGPFVGFSVDRWYLLGIVSWGEGCGRTGKYGYYTKVSNYIDWVKGLIKH